MQYKKYRKLKAMQTFKQKFSDMTREYRDGFRPQMIRDIRDSQSAFYAISNSKS